MKVTFLLITLIAVCGPAYGFDWKNSKRLLSDFRNFEALMDLEERAASEKKCSSLADVVFVIDRSRSIYPPDFQKAKVFVQKVIKLFDPRTSRFAAISFAEGATIEFDLRKYGPDQQATLNAIANLDQRTAIGDKTETWAALELLYNTVLQSSNLRDGVRPVAVLITDGASQNPERTAAKAAEAHSKGIKIIAIGIGNDAKESELRAIASDPDSENLFMLDDYGEALSKIKEEVASTACPNAIEGCEHKNPLDVVFSVSEHTNRYESEMTFKLISRVMSKATIGEGHIQFGLARRDCGNAWQQVALNQYDTMGAYSRGLASRLPSFKNELTQRLIYLQREAFTPATGDQPYANNVGIVFIDRRGDIDQSVRAQAGRMRNVRLIVVATGGVTAGDVRGLAAANDVIVVPGYAQMERVAEKVLDRLCKDALCKECFFWAFEEEIHKTIIDAKLFKRGDKVAVGASGGKDSTVLAYTMKVLNERYDYGVELVLLSVDEGITGYRDDSLETVKRNKEQYGLPLKIISYEELYGWTMDSIVKAIGLNNNCTFCGVFRRQALDRGAMILNCNKIVTGHNADDIAETVIMNVLRGDIARLRRCTAITTGTEGTLPRSKPFKYTYEKEIVMYAYFKKLDYFSTECIYSPNAYRGHARTFIKDAEKVRPSAIIDIIHSGESLSIKKEVKMPVQGTCTRCGYISSQPVCKACMLLEGLNKGLPRLGIGKPHKVRRMAGLPPKTSTSDTPPSTAPPETTESNPVSNKNIDF